jgi:hypothetical protein
MNPVHTSHLISQRSILILSSHILSGLPSGLFLSEVFRPKLCFISHLSHTCYMHRLSHPLWFDRPNNMWWSAQVVELLIMRSSPASCYFLPLRAKYERECIQKFPDWPLERELQIIQLSTTRCSCVAILWVSLASFAAITLCVASQLVFIVVNAYLVIDSVRKLLDILSYSP